mgnify:CR=1 FL=1
MEKIGKIEKNCFLFFKCKVKYKQVITKKMDQERKTIMVGLKTIPGGYGPILDNYNAKRPKGSQTIREAGVCEGGFEIPLDPEVLAQHIKNGRRLTPNEKVRQLRWNEGALVSMGYQALTQEETLLLYSALCHALGQNNVSLVKYRSF